jgi:hypothetical protein
MTKLLTLVVYMAGLTWPLLLAASLIRARGWTLEGTKIALGNRLKIGVRSRLLPL